MTKEDTRSPTVTQEGLILSCVINVMDNRDFDNTNITGNFLHTKMEGTVQVRLNGILANILLKFEPENYRDKVFIERSKKGIYTFLKCALHGYLISSLLFWRVLVVKLKSWGLHPNPYEPCIMNKDVYGNLCTVCWHMDDFKISYVQSAVVGDVLRCLE